MALRTFPGSASSASPMQTSMGQACVLAQLGSRAPAGTRIRNQPSRPQEDGQASVELVAAALALVIGGLAVFQVLAAGHAASVADNAAEAAALALVNGGDPEAAARAAAPPWARRDLRVRQQEGRVTITLQAPAALRLLDGHFEATARAAARRPGESGGR